MSQPFFLFLTQIMPFGKFRAKLREGARAHNALQVELTHAEHARQGEVFEETETFATLLKSLQK